MKFRCNHCGNLAILDEKYADLVVACGECGNGTLVAEEKLIIPIDGTVDQGEVETLRDKFAGKALQGLLSGLPDADCGPDGFAHDAYLYADAMLKERNR